MDHAQKKKLFLLNKQKKQKFVAISKKAKYFIFLNNIFIKVI